MLSEFTQYSKRPFNNSVMIISFNDGYGYLFANWYCSVINSKVDLEKLKSRLLVVATDTGARTLASSLGFFVVNPDKLFAWTNRRILTEAAGGFARGSHALINMAVKYGLTADLVSMGIDVTIMDTDFIWTGEALDGLYAECELYQCDGVFVKDGRPFLPALIISKDPIEKRLSDPLFLEPSAKNPYPQFNTGFFMIRSNPQTHLFMTTLMSVAFLQQWKGTDQLIFNSLIYHQAMPRMNFVQLPERRFIPGGSLHYGKALDPFPEPPELLAVHPSDADFHLKKITKLGKLGLWFLDDKRCPAALDLCERTSACLPLSRREFLNLVNGVEKDFFQS